MLLNNKYQDFEFINPLSDYLKSINESLSYLSTGLLFFSFVVLISSLFMMILVNYLFLKEGEKEIVIYSFLGYQKWSIFNYFLIINGILIFGGMVFSLTLLFITSLLLPMLDSSITSVYLSFLPFGLIIGVCLLSFIISSLINMRFFIKKDVISLLKN
jgi:ABC-type antimicrobial peptide transport system permease subunit